MPSVPPPLLFLPAPLLLEAGGTFAITLSWTNAVNYDKVIIASSAGSGPASQQDLDGSTENYTFHGFPPGTSIVLSVKGGVHGDLLEGTDPAEWYYSDWASTTVQTPLPGASVLTGAFPQLLLYKQSTGSTWTMPIFSGTTFGKIMQIGAWDNISSKNGGPWSQLVPFVIFGLKLGGTQCLLLYKQKTGEVWSGLLADDVTTGLSSIAPVVVRWLDPSGAPITWETDWTQILSVVVGGNPVLFFYSPPPQKPVIPGQPPRPGRFFSAPLLSPIAIGDTTAMTTTERVKNQPWSIIAPFVVNDSTFLLFYDQETGHTYTAPVVSETEIGEITQIGVWDNISSTKDGGPWSQLAAFTVGGAPFLLLYKQSTGITWTMPIFSGTTFGKIVQIGAWDNISSTKDGGPWSHIGPFNPFNP